MLNNSDIDILRPDLLELSYNLALRNVLYFITSFHMERGRFLRISERILGIQKKKEDIHSESQCVGIECISTSSHIKQE